MLLSVANSLLIPMTNKEMERPFTTYRPPPPPPQMLHCFPFSSKSNHFKNKSTQEQQTFQHSIPLTIFMCIPNILFATPLNTCSPPPPPPPSDQWVKPHRSQVHLTCGQDLPMPPLLPGNLPLQEPLLLYGGTPPTIICPRMLSAG